MREWKFGQFTKKEKEKGTQTRQILQFYGVHKYKWETAELAFPLVVIFNESRIDNAICVLDGKQYTFFKEIIVVITFSSTSE